MTITAVKKALMLITGPKKETSIQAGWRLPESLVKFIKAQTKSLAKGAETQLVIDALGIYRELSQIEKLRLVKYATDHGLDFGASLPEVIGRAVREALEAHEKSQK